MSIVGIDLGQTIGWVKGDPVGQLRWGSFTLANTTDLGAWLESADEILNPLLRGATGVAVEQPFMGKNYFPVRKLIALLGQVHRWARIHNIHYQAIQEIAIPTGKRTLSGSGKADKDMMIAAAAAHGYEGMTEHEADALGVWWVYQFGAAEPAKRPSKRSSKGVSLISGADDE
ncbi:MAG: hypothetical protein KKA05_10515 [Alphaproteobacteria bacterium]|nr:hypothetical protein [Alphaproteobacteria bacterium]